MDEVRSEEGTEEELLLIRARDGDGGMYRRDWEDEERALAANEREIEYRMR